MRTSLYTYLRARKGSVVGVAVALRRTPHRPRAKQRIGSDRAAALTRIMHGQQWRCSKNAHLLDPHRHPVCPIDGSPCGWVDHESTN